MEVEGGAGAAFCLLKLEVHGYSFHGSRSEAQRLPVYRGSTAQDLDFTCARQTRATQVATSGPDGRGMDATPRAATPDAAWPHPQHGPPSTSTEHPEQHRAQTALDRSELARSRLSR